MEWKPIESAPKDGTWVDLWTPNHFESGVPARMPECRWGHPNWHRIFGPFPSDVPKGFECWVNGAAHAVADPTHWMPLPSPPTEEVSTTLEEDMVLRVARAIDPLAWAEPEPDDFHEADRTASLEAARAAIEAMREPTKVQLAAGDAADWISDYDPADPDSENRTGNVYRAMIDAALTKPSAAAITKTP